MIGGMNVQMLARSQLGWDLTGSSLAVTMVGIGFAPPMLLFSVFGGVVSDRFDNKHIIQQDNEINSSRTNIVYAMYVL